MSWPSLDDIRAAQERIRHLTCRTPLKPSLALSERCGRSIFLKLETMQATGAFKLRGAANAVLSLSPEQRRQGVATQSSGNHGRAVAYVARELQIPALICLSEATPPTKVEAVRRLGAEVVVVGKDQDACWAIAQEMARDRGLTFVPPFDDAAVIAGQGTIGLELLEQRPSLDTVLVPLSGGGLAAGVAVAIKALQPSVRILGASTQHGAAMYESIVVGEVVAVSESPSLADALVGGLPDNNRYTFDICRQLLDGHRQVAEESLARAMVHGLRQERLVLEGGGAIGLATLLDDGETDLGSEVAVICTGDNVDIDKLLAMASADDLG